jgi:protein MpaA
MLGSVGFIPVAISAALVALTGCTGTSTTGESVARPDRPVRHSPQISVRSRPIADALVRRRVLLGYSVRHRPITAEEIGDADSPRRALIVGCIHGNEPAGMAIAKSLSAATALPEVDLWIVRDLNPDGVAARTRDNADGVDLNRNFPDHWTPLGPPGSLHYAGPGPLSEPESRAVAALLSRLHPTLGIWYHQALNVVDDSQGPAALERRYAADTGMSLRPLTDFLGSATGYEDRLSRRTAFVVELPGGELTARQVRVHARAALDVAARSGPGRA